MFLPVYPSAQTPLEYKLIATFVARHLTPSSAAVHATGEVNTAKLLSIPIL